MNNNVTKIIIVIIIIANIVLVTATSISIGSAVRRQLVSESTSSVVADVSFSTLIKEIFNSNNFIAIIKTIEGVNLIVFGVLIAMEATKF